MMQAVRQYSKKLWVNYVGIRSLKPINIKALEPLYFTGFDIENDYENFLELLEKQTSIIDIEYDAEEEVAIVYAENP